MSAADLCSLIVATVDGSSLGDGIVLAYGAHPDDAILVPPPTRITVLVVNDNRRRRWFDIIVREADLSGDPTGLFYDPEILATLSRRADRNTPRK